MGLAGSARDYFLAAILGISSISVLTGMFAIARFDDTPGKVMPAPERWPLESSVSRSKTGPELVVFAHPFCSCTVATLHELESLPVKPHTTVLFFRPSPNSRWRAERLWQMAKQLPNTNVLWDEGGREARRFGAATSGYMILYDAAGRLLFRGGVTATRGHEGDNEGLTTLIETLRSGVRASHVSRVFGCGISGRTDAGE